ncbi:MAG: hypothetical protein K5753_01265 [Clostridia bacterium]|nr:hypothetical protein [Clostridia bacterium]
MEDRLLVAKALVSCYAHIDDVCEALERSAEKCALDGFYAIYPSDQMRLYERLIKNNERKRNLVNMKYVIERGLSGIKTGNAALLRERYEFTLARSDLMKKLGISLRTLYRRFDRALEEFACALDRFGFDQKRILREFGNEPLFSVSLNRVIKEDDEAREMREKMKNAAFDAYSERYQTRVIVFQQTAESGFSRTEQCV